MPGGAEAGARPTGAAVRDELAASAAFRPGSPRMETVQRGRMLAAAARTVAEEGAARVTVAGVVERAGMSRRTFYELFAGAQDCLSALLAQSLAELGEHVLPAFRTAPGGWRGRIRAALSALLVYFDERPDVARLLVVEWLAAGPDAVAERRRVSEQVAAAVAEGARDSQPPVSPLLAEAVVNGVLGILHARLCGAPSERPLAELTGPLMATIVLPYLGPAAARAELAKPAPSARRPPPRRGQQPLAGLDMRLTQRTVSVIAAIAAAPGSTNRAIGDCAEIVDQGQISKLLMRLRRLGLIVNLADDARRQGAPNAWVLSADGERLARSLRIEPPGG